MLAVIKLVSVNSKFNVRVPAVLINFIYRYDSFLVLVIGSVADLHLLLCGSGIQKISIWIRFLGGKDQKRKITPKIFQINLSK